MSTRREVLKSFLGASVTPLLAARERGKPLNFVFLLIDDMGWMDAAVYGSKLYETPNIDRLAGQGMRFANAYAAAPLCSPTRASILTGKYPARLHLTMALPGKLPPKPNQKLMGPQMPPGLPLSEVTIAEMLKPAGYVSAAIGKWHLGGEPFYPEKQGFDVTIAGTDIGMAPSQFFPAWKGKTRGVPIEGRPGEYLGDRLTDEAIRFIETNKDRPFFLYLAHYAVHTPIEAKQALIEKYEAKVDPKSPQHHPIYAAMVESVDDSVGRVMKRLDELGIADKTVVFFMSDNGGVVHVQTYTKDPLEPTSTLPLREGKATLYEGGIREPMIVKWPGVVKAGAICNVPVISNDFFPTIAEMARVKPGSNGPIDGVSLVPLLQGKGRPNCDALYWYYPHYDYRAVAAVRKGDYKLLEFMDDDHLELYNLAEDIAEKNDLSTTLPKKTAELRKMLHKWQKAVRAQPMAPNPQYRPALVSQNTK